MRRSNLLIWLPYYDNNIILQIKRQEVFVILLESLKNFLTKIVHFVKKYSYTGRTRQHRRKKALVLHPSDVFLCRSFVGKWSNGQGFWAAPSAAREPCQKQPRKNPTKSRCFALIFRSAQRETTGASSDSPTNFAFMLLPCG